MTPEVGLIESDRTSLRRLSRVGGRCAGWIRAGLGCPACSTRGAQPQHERVATRGQERKGNQEVGHGAAGHGRCLIGWRLVCLCRARRASILMHDVPMPRQWFSLMVRRRPASGLLSLRAIRTDRNAVMHSQCRTSRSTCMARSCSRRQPYASRRADPHDGGGWPSLAPAHTPQPPSSDRAPRRVSRPAAGCCG